MMGNRRSTVIWGVTAGTEVRLRPSWERRSGDRFPIECELRHKWWSHGQSDSGSGRTVNISSNGVQFVTASPPPPGARIEVSILWPAQLDGKCNLKLVATGRVVWSRGETAGIRIEKYEFRTAGRKGLCALVS